MEAFEYAVKKDIRNSQIVRELVQQGWQVINADVTLIAEVPRVAPHVAVMREYLAVDLGVAPAAVNVKATTSEGLGFTGRKEGIAAQAVALIVRRAGPVE